MLKVFAWLYAIFVASKLPHLDFINEPIFLRRFKLFMLSFMFYCMFANICSEKNQNGKIHVMFIQPKTFKIDQAFVCDAE